MGIWQWKDEKEFFLFFHRNHFSKISLQTFLFPQWFLLLYTTRYIRTYKSLQLYSSKYVRTIWNCHVERLLYVAWVYMDLWNTWRVKFSMENLFTGIIFFSLHTNSRNKRRKKKWKCNLCDGIYWNSVWKKRCCLSRHKYSTTMCHILNEI